MRLWSLLAVEAVLLLMVAPVGLAQESPYAVATADPSIVPVSGRVVRFSIDVVISDADLPATITALTSDLHGDITDSANSLLVSTDCAAPVAYAPTGGWIGMACSYEALVAGPPGEVTNTISADVQLAGGSVLTLADSVVVTISADLGGIRATLVDADTGLPIPDLYVWGPREDFTDSSGTFFIDGLDPGVYRLYSGNAPHGTSGVPPGYSTVYAYEWYDEEPVGLPTPWPNPGTPITVLAGEITEIQWELSVGGEITGEVTAAGTGMPLTDYQVLIWMTGSNGLASSLEIGGNRGGDVATDGTYRVFGLRAGEYIVCFESPYGNECWDDLPRTTIPPDQGDPVSVVLGGTTSGINAQLLDEGNGNGGNGGTEGGVLPFTGVEPWLALTAVALVVAGAGVLATSLRKPD